MKITSQSITATASLILAAAISFYVYKSATTAATNQASIAAGIDSLSKSVNQLNLSVQRLNTTTVQLDYLKNEIGRLANLDQSIAKRIELEKAQQAKTPTADGEKHIKEMAQVQSKVQKDLKNRREGVVMIISGLERQLQTSNGTPTAVKNPSKNTDESDAEPVDPAPEATGSSDAAK